MNYESLYFKDAPTDNFGAAPFGRDGPLAPHLRSASQLTIFSQGLKLAALFHPRDGAGEPTRLWS